MAAATARRRIARSNKTKGPLSRVRERDRVRGEETKMRLENKNAIVTGAAKGMGAAITLTLAREGADVLLTAAR